MLNTQAGLGAMMAQPQQLSQGMPAGNMAQMAALAKEMSDSQLAAVLAGKSMDIPQYVAMTEAMGRNSLRTAVQGMQAQQQAKTPTVKDKTLAGLAQSMHPQGMRPQMPEMPQQPTADAAGISALPAPNMEEVGDVMGKANGGIIAFSGEDQSDVKGFDASDWRSNFSPTSWLGNPNSTLNRIFSSAGTDITPEQKALAAKNYQQNEILRLAKAGNPNAQSAANVLMGQGVDPTAAGFGVAPPAASVNSRVPMDTAAATNPQYQQVGATNVGTTPGVDTSTGTPYGQGAPGSYNAPVGGAGVAPKASTPSAGVAQATPAPVQGPEKHPDYFEGMGKDDLQDTIKQQKEQAQGEFLIHLGAGLLSSPNLATGLAKGSEMGLPGLAASRKEINALQQHQKEYQLNLAKAKEARDNGNDKLAFDYLKQADDKAYQTGMLAVHNAQIAQTGASQKATQEYQMKHLDIEGKKAEAQMEYWKNAGKYSDPALTAQNNAALSKAVEAEWTKLYGAGVGQMKWSKMSPVEQAAARQQLITQLAPQYPNNTLTQKMQAPTPFGLDPNAIAAELQRRQGQ